MKSFRNWLRHLVGVNKGEVTSITTPNGKVLIGFLCFECDKIHDVHESYVPQSYSNQQIDLWLDNRYGNHNH